MTAALDPMGAAARPAEAPAGVRVTVPPGEGPILAPTGIATPYGSVVSLAIEGAGVARHLTCPDLGLGALLLDPGPGPVTLTYAATAEQVPYPEAAFRPRRNRHTTPSDDLATHSRAVAERAGGGRAAIEALVAEAEARFDYGHPEIRFTDGLDHVPYLACGTTPGSCVDINTYLLASLRAAGIEAAYLVGYFFRHDGGGRTPDNHCWVATRAEGEVLHWDIAHHIKFGLGPVRPGLNPREGVRIAVSHSMGHRYPGPAGPLEMKLLGEPVRVRGTAAEAIEGLEIRLL